MDLGLNATHYPGSHHVLFEGNQGVNMDGDATHGSGSDYMVFYRNWSTGLRTPFTDPEGNSANDFIANGDLACGTTGRSGCRPYGPGSARAAGAWSYNYWYAFVGNVLGTTLNNVIGGTPFTTAANGWHYDSCTEASCNYNIWAAGNADLTYNSDTNLYYGTTKPWYFKDGNYDFYHQAVIWANSSHRLPRSLYVTSAPSFFSAGASCTYPWPWVTPRGSRPLQTAGGSGSCPTYSGLPAKARWDAGTPFVQP
jgi:hypothetical protein